MSAAATAAGYLYASGRLRGRAQREQEGHDEHQHRESAPRQKPAARQLRVDRPRREVRVAALPPQQEPDQLPVREKPRRTPTVQYRTRRWRPSEEPSE